MILTLRSVSTCRRYASANPPTLFTQPGSPGARRFDIESDLRNIIPRGLLHRHGVTKTFHGLACRQRRMNSLCAWSDRCVVLCHRRVPRGLVRRDLQFITLRIPWCSFWTELSPYVIALQTIAYYHCVRIHIDVPQESPFHRAFDLWCGAEGAAQALDSRTLNPRHTNR